MIALAPAPATPKPILRYPGGKARIAPWILAHLPPHEIYVEPYAGAASVLLSKPRSAVEVLNDLDGRVVNLFRVLRERPDELARMVTLTPYALAEYRESDDPTGDPLEDARRYLVRVWMAHAGKLGSRSGWRNGDAGGKDGRRGASSRVWAGLPERIAAVAERLTDVLIDCRPALEVVADWAHPSALVYADPPYLVETLVTDRNYRHDLTRADHEALLDALDAHPGPVALSGYRSGLYDGRLAHWTRVDKEVRAYRSAKRVESLWLNPRAAEQARQPQLGGLA